MTSIGSKIANGTVWTAAETWGQQATLFVVFVALARLLDPHTIGLAALALVAPIILAVPVTRGIPDAIIQRPNIDSAHLDSAFWLLAGAGAALSALVVLLAGPIAYVFGQPVIEELVRFTGLIVFIQSLAGVPIAILKRHLNFRVLAMRTLCATIISGVVGIGLALEGYGVWSLVWMQLTKCTVELVVLLLGTAWRPRLRFSRAHCDELFGFAWPIVGCSLWSYVNDELPKIALGAFLGPNAVGIYAVARRPLELLSSVFLAPITGMAMPAMARLQGDRDKVDQFFDGSIRVVTVLGFPAFIGLAAIAPDAVPLIFGEQWAGSVVAVQILLLLGLVRTVDSICAGTVLALGHSGLILKFNIAYTFLAAVFITAGASVSVEATMAAIVFCNLVLVPPFLLYTQRLSGIDVTKPLATLPRLILATLLMFASVTAWRHATGGAALPVELGGAIAIGMLVYGGMAMVLLRPDLLATRDLLLRIRG
jgi:O-antigen/teichoic acid export membrane protein